MIGTGIDASPWAAHDPVLPGRFRVGSAAAACVHATTQAAADLFAARGGDPGPVSVDVRHAAAHFRSERYLRVDGEPAGGEDPLTGNYKAADGWVRLHCNYPHHRDAAMQVVGTDFAAGVASRKAIDVEQAVVAAGGAAAAQRSREEWAAHPQGIALRRLPLLSIEQIGDAPPIQLSKADRPLSGVRVLDMTHVIAGPVCGRTLAAHGADVLHVGAEHLPVVRPILLDTQFGKRSTFIDLRTAEGADTLRALVRADADVFIESFRPGSLAAKGFGPADLAAMRPGIVVVEISAWGWEGPWRTRRGFDSLAQLASGIAAGDPPVPLPAQFLDHGTGWLAAYGVLTALRRRMETGGSWLVKVALARTGLWLDELGKTEVNGKRLIVDDLLTTTPSPFGLLTHIRMPGSLPGAQPNWAHGSPVPGSAKPEWW
ncbi:CoA transferase [Kibdelosporangium aridum]|uniref:CoA transferase n=1 Tax=Kibdelosporangium aridum TaxID=2030 RepID=UPI0009FEE57D|nr:CoA transferase [Kibdelosporangium aridum]